MRKAMWIVGMVLALLAGGARATDAGEPIYGGCVDARGAAVPALSDDQLPAVVATGIDPTGLSVRTLVGGRERQNFPVADMIFAPAQLVSLISRDMTLEPGDLIACGTSVGVLPMKAGNVVEVSIEGVGTLRNEYRQA